MQAVDQREVAEVVGGELHALGRASGGAITLASSTPSSTSGAVVSQVNGQVVVLAAGVLAVVVVRPCEGLGTM